MGVLGILPTSIILVHQAAEKGETAVEWMFGAIFCDISGTLSESERFYSAASVVGS